MLPDNPSTVIDILLNSSGEGILVLFGAFVCSGKNDAVFVVSMVDGVVYHAVVMVCGMALLAALLVWTLEGCFITGAVF